MNDEIRNQVKEIFNRIQTQEEFIQHGLFDIFGIEDKFKEDLAKARKMLSFCSKRIGNALQLNDTLYPDIRKANQRKIKIKILLNQAKVYLSISRNISNSLMKRSDKLMVNKENKIIESYRFIEERINALINYYTQYDI